MDNVFNDLFAAAPHDNRFYGVTVGIVTNNKDEEKLGRVKVQFPWLSAEDESHWARIATPMSGQQMGLFFLPEVGDEVLVAFQHGMMEFPYIIGSLWNGKEKPPETNDDGKNNLRFIKSRSGHIIRLDDTDGSEKIEVIDKSGKNTIVIDVAANSITITSEGTIDLTAKKDITIKSSGGDVSIQGTNIEIKASGKFAAQASGQGELKAGGPLTVKGAVVNIN
ncbi:MAG: phage baseplate assembly protein V [Phototrophicaceae bacterium]